MGLAAGIRTEHEALSADRPESSVRVTVVSHQRSLRGFSNRPAIRRGQQWHVLLSHPSFSLKVFRVVPGTICSCSRLLVEDGRIRLNFNEAAIVWMESA
jgi:hypothetical protein